MISTLNSYLAELAHNADVATKQYGNAMSPATIVAWNRAQVLLGQRADFQAEPIRHYQVTWSESDVTRKIATFSGLLETIDYYDSLHRKQQHRPDKYTGIRVWVILNGQGVELAL